ncbi:MAG: cytochrome b5 domain-containing protein [Candidatus Magasanikbacteria bacterium]|nr:cytochrome b5 domain-containing protein [Candidatus Magasanikbacteria bacterium]
MQKNKSIGLSIGLLVLILAGGSAFSSSKKAAYRANKPAFSVGNSTSQPSSVSGNNTSPSQATGISFAPSAKSFTLEQIAVHNSATRCWTAVNGNVYDLTQWISQHPGGDTAILSMCGLDSSAGFNNQHGGQGKPERVLASFEIGLLIK